MAAKAKAPARSVAVPTDELPVSGPWFTPPATTADRLVQIRALGKRIDGYIRFICAAGSLGGTSAEAKEKAVAVFYECLQTLERRLDRIQDDLRLE